VRVTGVAPGWYADPGDPSQLRYWDGARWTERTAPLQSEPPAPAPAGQPRKRWPWVVAGVAAVAALAAVAVALFVVGGTDDAKAEVILEPAAASGDDAFTDSVASITVKVSHGGVKEVKGGGRPVESVSGSAPGLYGGTGDQEVCDPKALVGFLKKNPDKAAAFAAVLGIAPGEIERYVTKLTPVLLREDTRVTNHGYQDGHATTLQSVLQAGTAVMVDDRGIPRVRCACGNPLTEPTAVTSSPEYRGERWQDFDDRRLVAISESPRPISRFKVVDVRNGREYDQSAGSGTLTVKRLLNFRIPVEVCGDLRRGVPWKNGIHPDSGKNGSFSNAFVPGAKGAPGGTGGDLQAVVGDVTGDGTDEGVLTAVESCGGSGVFGATYVFQADGKLLAKLPDAVNEPGAGFAENHDNLRIVNGGIELTATGYAGSDAHCCPSLRERVRYEWNGSKFVVR
jgi:hypothetical protein